MNNAFYIAAAGSGKTTFIINKALSKKEATLITTYTIANTNEIRKKIIAKLGYIPANIEIKTWYDFLLSHGVRPYQGAMNNTLYEKRIGFKFQNEKSGLRYTMKDGTPVYFRESEIHYYFTNDNRIYSDKVSEFIIKCNDNVQNKIIERINKIYRNIYIDEAQDLSGYDLDIIKLLFNTNSEIILLGDPRQTIYLTHPSQKYKKYQNGNIEGYFINEIGKKIKCQINYDYLNVSHRNNKFICDYSSKLYLNMKKTYSCNCEKCRSINMPHEGIYIVKEADVASYLENYSPIQQLRPDKNVKCTERYPVRNFGETKGLTFDRVLIYPTKTMIEWIKDNSKKLADKTKANFYVAITRARYSVGIVINYNNNDVDKDGYCFNDRLLFGYNFTGTDKNEKTS